MSIEITMKALEPQFKEYAKLIVEAIQPEYLSIGMPMKTAVAKMLEFFMYTEEKRPMLEEAAMLAISSHINLEMPRPINDDSLVVAKRNDEMIITKAGCLKDDELESTSELAREVGAMFEYSAAKLKQMSIKH